MNIFIIGAAGNVGTRIRREALSRGHQVTGMTRKAAKLSAEPGLTVVEGDVMDTAHLAASMKDHDALVVSHGSPPDDPKGGPKTILAADSIIDAMREAGLMRVLWVGGAGSLFTADGKRVFDTVELPAWAGAGIWSMAAHLAHLKTITDLEWTFLSPSLLIGPGERTGQFRLGKDHLLVDENSQSSISYEDYAVAVLDELENPQHVRQRFTVGY